MCVWVCMWCVSMACACVSFCVFVLCVYLSVCVMCVWACGCVHLCESKVVDMSCGI